MILGEWRVVVWKCVFRPDGPKILAGFGGVGGVGGVVAKLT